MTFHLFPSTITLVPLLTAILLLAQLSGPPAPAPASSTRPLLAPGSHVYVITMDPGDQPWEKFGHNMLWIHDSDSNTDLACNWGVFEFNNQFIWNFIQGRLWYWMEIDTPAQAVIDYYINTLDRTAYLQELNFSPSQANSLRDLCLWNAQDQNRFYKYDYYRDNCSTRVRDALNTILAGQLQTQAAAIPSDLTYRSETRRLTAPSPWLYVCLDYILGHPVDQKITAWDEMFIPMRMRQRLNQLTIRDNSGRQLPLVKNEILLHTSSRAPARTSPPQWIPWFFLAGLALGAAQAWCADRVRCNFHPLVFKLVFVAFSVPWSLLCGLAGSFLLYLWLFTDHTAVRANENILQLGPLLLPLVLLIPLALRNHRLPARLAFALATLAALASALGLLLKLLPVMSQANADMIALALPANLGLARALWLINTGFRLQSHTSCQSKKE